MILKKSKQAEDGTILLIAEPFEPFNTDCDHCKHFFTTPLAHPTGECQLHGFICGYGFTCKDFYTHRYYAEKLN